MPSCFSVIHLHHSQLEYWERSGSVWAKVPWTRAPGVHQLQDLWGHGQGAAPAAGRTCRLKTERGDRYVLPICKTWVISWQWTWADLSLFVEEIVKKELLKLVERCFIGYPNLITTAKVIFIALCFCIHTNWNDWMSTESTRECLISLVEGWRHQKGEGGRSGIHAEDAV